MRPVFPLPASMWILQNELVNSFCAFPFCSLDLRLYFDILAELIRIGEVLEVLQNFWPLSMIGGLSRVRFPSVCVDMGRYIVRASRVVVLVPRPANVIVLVV